MRSVKPEFFTDGKLGELSPLHRLLFAGLWCQADRMGRLEDKPRELKVKVLPYDDCDVDGLLTDLDRCGFVRRYVVDGKKLVWIVHFLDHQRPHKLEPVSKLPEFKEAPTSDWVKPVVAPSSHLLDPPGAGAGAGAGSLVLGSGSSSPQTGSTPVVASSTGAVPVEEEEQASPGFDLQKPTGCWAWIQAMRERKGIPGEIRMPRDWNAWHAAALTEVGVDGIDRAYRRYLDDDPESRRPDGWPTTACFIAGDVWRQRAIEVPKRRRL